MVAVPPFKATAPSSQTPALQASRQRSSAVWEREPNGIYSNAKFVRTAVLSNASNQVSSMQSVQLVVRSVDQTTHAAKVHKLLPIASKECSPCSVNSPAATAMAKELASSFLFGRGKKIQCHSFKHSLRDSPVVSSSSRLRHRASRKHKCAHGGGAQA